VASPDLSPIAPTVEPNYGRLHSGYQAPPRWGLAAAAAAGRYRIRPAAVRGPTICVTCRASQRARASGSYCAGLAFGTVLLNAEVAQLRVATLGVVHEADIGDERLDDMNFL